MKHKIRIEHNLISKHGNEILEGTKLSLQYQNPNLPVPKPTNEPNFIPSAHFPRTPLNFTAHHCILQVQYYPPVKA
jgi:hypothetical protein